MGSEICVLKCWLEVKKAVKYSSFILIINVLFFLALEGTFHLFNWFKPFSYFVESRNERGEVWVQYRIGPIKPKFLKSKSTDTFRIFSFGGSTTMGSPFYPKSSFSRMLELALNRSGPGKKVEVINLGASGMNSLEIFYCLREALKYKPDLAIIYCGQNEFFQASFFADWRYPNLDRAVDVLRLHSRLYRALKAADKILPLIPAAIGTHQELVETLNLDLGQLPLENRPMSRQFYNDRIQSYRYHLQKILAMLGKSDVPTIICTLTVNLKDWPPEWIPFPQGLSEQQRDELKSRLYNAYLNIADGQTIEAAKLLQKSRPLAHNYAMFDFVQAWLDEKQGHYETARENFLRARKLDNSRHRAPPEIIQIIRELAPEYGAALADIEELFFKNAITTPGFDLFTDHVHPNLKGQRLIAQELYNIMNSKGLIRISRPLARFPSEDEFKNAFQIDQDFLDNVKLHLAVYYLLQKRLPGRDRQTIQYLNEILSRHPDNVFARICLVSLMLEQARIREAQSMLEACFRSSRPELIQKTLERYFFPKIVMQGNYLLFRLNFDPVVPPMRGIMLVRQSPEQTRIRSGLDLDQYNWIFQYDPKTGKVPDITKAARSEYESAKARCKSESAADIDLIVLMARTMEVHANDIKPKPSTSGLTFNTIGKDPWFYFPVELNAPEASNLKIEISVRPEEKTKPAELSLYWSSGKAPVFSEAKKISLPLKTNGKFQTFEIKLSENLNWLASGKISYLRLDPPDLPGTAKIRQFKLRACSSAPYQ